MREIIKLQSEESSDFYTTKKNRRKHPEKMRVKKFDRKLRKHCFFKETKLK